ncbi:MAG: PDZ domain-containing protein [Neisseria sp.]|nr:PDZ domain-containing protein [Neisseria sp.]
MLHFSLRPEPKKHLWHITLSFEHTRNENIELSLANWVPGSYMIRDFCKNIITIEASCNGKAKSLTQLNKNRWLADNEQGSWQICYTVYALDMSVRSSFLDTERGFFDGACLFLRVKNRENETHTLQFENLPSHWQIATTLPKQQADLKQFFASSYAELIDHPVEMGDLEILSFVADSITHRVALSGHYADFDRQRFCQDLQKICEQELAMFPRPAPFGEYLFLLYLGDNIYGGLEHISSTALHCDRHSLPADGMGEASDAYIQLLGLCSHEYFHAWNVKSIKPAAFVPYQLDSESHTEQLWAFEGITSYYDDLFLVRSGVISPERYLKLLAKNFTRVQQGAGKNVQTLAESSFAAWHKYYKQDENSVNAIVSYYQKGAIAALCLDLTIRQRSQNQYSLDDVMRVLYQDWVNTGEGIAEKQWQVRCQEITGLNLQDFFELALYSTQDSPLAECLASVGVDLQWHALPRSHGGDCVASFPDDNKVATDFGAKFSQTADGIKLSQVFSDGSAQNAGLSPHDKIIAINGYACTDFATQWAKYRVGDVLRVHYFRQGVLHETELRVQTAAADTALVRLADEALLQTWIAAN